MRSRPTARACAHLYHATLTGVASAPQDAAAFVDNFYIPEVSDGAGGSISKAKNKGKAQILKSNLYRDFYIVKQGQGINSEEYSVFDVYIVLSGADLREFRSILLIY